MEYKYLSTVEFREYIIKTRWWPWKNTWRDIVIIDSEEIGDFTYIVFKVDDKLFQLPLVRVSSVPKGLEQRSFCIENNCFIEAEYSVEYLNYFTKLSKHSLELVNNYLFEIYSARPLSLETTNTTVIYNTSLGEIVLKNYRLVPKVNTEYLIIKKLVEEKYSNIPRVIAFLKYRDFTSGILMYYVKSSGDGGKPFYELFIKKLKGYSTGEAEKLLSSKLGVIIGEMHKTLNYSVRNNFYGVEEINDSDIEYWIKRCEKYYKNSMFQMDKHLSRASSRDKFIIEYWRDFYEKITRDLLGLISDLMNNQREMFKGRIHQDLHLAQMIYVEETSDFIITDFEGEPGRSDEERLLKEPLFRDIASIIRSFQYLTHSAIVNHYGYSVHTASMYLLKNDPSIDWRKNVSESLIKSYLSRIIGYKLLTQVEEHVVSNYWVYIKPWLIERALYEVFYESLYRPTWVSIPLVGLYQVLFIIT